LSSSNICGIPETEEKVRKSQQTETFSSLRFAREYRRLKPRISFAIFVQVFFARGH
jgi:hypothetical protein